MRFFRKTVFWVIVLAVLSGVFYFFDKKVEEKEQVEEATKRLFSVAPDSITEFEIIKADSIIHAKKGSAGWLIEKPVISLADQTAIGDMLDHTLRAKVDGVLFDKAAPEKLKEMGLEPPYITLRLKTASGEVSLSLGDRGPTQNITFALLGGDERVLRVHADVRSEIDKSVFDLRDKTAISIEPNALKVVETKWDHGGTIVVRHPQENIWDTDGLPQGKTDETSLLAFLYGVKEAKVKAFIDEAPKDLTPFGLDKPRLKIRFIDNKNLQQYLLVGGKDKKLRGFYAKRGGEPNVFLLEEDFLDKIPDEAKDLELK